MEGVLVIDKPSGMTSHDVVDCVRRKFKMRRVGHAGTLDPLATGVLIVLVGRATKLSEQLMGCDKAYRSTMLLGTKTDSADTQGTVIEQKSFDGISPEEIKKVFESFKGEIKQLPPMYSAVKYKGRKLYELARKGITVERTPRLVYVNSLKIEDIALPSIRFYLECSKGTYVRQLADDIGDQLGCGACISQLQRTKVGSFSLDDAVNIEDIDERYLRNIKL